VQAVGGEVHADLKLEFCELKLHMCEMKAQLGQVIVKIMEAKEEIKEEIAKGNNSPPVISC
jgi:RNAse (barnase) inhibitor barstar